MIQVYGNQTKTAVSFPSLQKIQKDVMEAMELVMGDNSPELMDEMSGTFMEDAIPLINQMKDGYSNQNYQAISVAAHTLKSSSATMGLAQLADLCLAIEVSSKQQKLDKLGLNISSLESNYVQVQEALAAFII
ncbi:MAG: hypothetical protein GY805_31280 [Chloroflexi bacterium]|nr:hypothetical protein [Chloroflexota bacterium]